MKKIGFIDFFLDEWHANNYPKWIRQASAAARGLKPLKSKFFAQMQFMWMALIRQRGLLNHLTRMYGAARAR